MKNLLFITILLFSISCNQEKEQTQYKNLVIKYNSKNNIQKKLDYIIEGINLSCPTMINNDIRFDKVINGENKEMIYLYTYVNLYKNEITWLNTKEMKEKLINLIKSNPYFSFYRKNKISFSYIFRDKEGIYVGKFKINSNEIK